MSAYLLQSELTSPVSATHVYIIGYVRMFYLLAAPEDEPQQLNAFSVLPDTIVLNWKEPTIPNGPIVAYAIMYNETDTHFMELVVNKSRVNITGLIPFTFYKIKVHAFTRIGGGPFVTATVRTAESSKFVQCVFVSHFICFSA